MPTIPAGDAKRRGNIPSELDRLTDAVEYLSNTITELETNLNPALAPPAPPEVAAKDSAVDVALVPIAESIRTQRQRIDYINKDIRMLIDRLEL